MIEGPSYHFSPTKSEPSVHRMYLRTIPSSTLPHIHTNATFVCLLFWTFLLSQEQIILFNTLCCLCF